MAGRLQGKVALITGASSGIGEETALALAAEGARVALAARRADRLASLASRITDDGGEALPLMQAQGGGEIVNVSSVAGRVARLGNGVYAATKFGVVAFSESLRQEVTKQHIRVTVIEPGAVDTELSSHITQEQARKTTDEWIRSIAPLHSEDIAAAITFVVTQPPHVSINELLVRPTDQDR